MLVKGATDNRALSHIACTALTSITDMYIMGAMASQITGVSIVCSAVCSGADGRKHQSFASLAFVRLIHRWPVDSPHKGPVTRKMFPSSCIPEKKLSDNTINSLWPSDVIWRRRSWSILVQVTAYCLVAPSLPEPISTDHRWGLVAITRGQCQRKRLVMSLKKYQFQITFAFLMDQ